MPALTAAMWASFVAQLVKNQPAMQKSWVRSLGWEGPLEKGLATHARILAWRIPWTVWSMGSQRVGHDWATFTHFTSSQEQASFNFMAAVTVHNDFGAQENEICHCFHFFLIYLPWRDPMPWSSFSECWVLSQVFHFPLSCLSRGSLVPLHFLPLEWYHLHI